MPSAIGPAEIEHIVDSIKEDFRQKPVRTVVSVGAAVVVLGAAVVIKTVGTWLGFDR